MKKSLATGLLLLSLSAIAHEDLDWGKDYMAFLSVEYELPLVTQTKKPAKGKKPFSMSPGLDMVFFKEKLEVLTGVKPHIYQGKPTFINERQSQDTLNIARDFLAQEYGKLGFTTDGHTFSNFFKKGTNFIAEKKGTREPNKVLILSSHIDSVGNRGANDDGTGTIGLLTVAQELARMDHGLTIRILGFDREEAGMKGSEAYVSTLHKNDETVVGNINFEMMGFNSRKDGAFHVIDCSRKDSLFLSSAVKASIASLDLPLTVVKACTDRSDHSSFWRRGIPAIVISENFFGGDADPCYHSKCDVMDERLDYGYMQNILTAVLDATQTLVE